MSEAFSFFFIFISFPPAYNNNSTRNYFPDRESPSFSNLTLDAILNEDVERALKRMKPSAKQFREKYEKWQSEFGSV